MRLDALRAGDWVLLGPTAAGKTRLAARLARALGADVVAVDSRQVYRGLDLCSGKDRADYELDDGPVTVHGMDRVDLTDEYSLFEFARDACNCADCLAAAGWSAVWCGGSGLYLDALLRGYHLPEAPVDEAWRRQVESRSLAELERELRTGALPLHNRTDIEGRGHVLRALEVSRAGRGRQAEGAERGRGVTVVGLRWPAARLRERITRRLDERLEQGLVREVEELLAAGVPAQRLHRLGLEPRWILRHLQEGLGLPELQAGLAGEIWQLARGQLSWFRRLERAGVRIHWLDAEAPGDLLERALALRG